MSSQLPKLLIGALVQQGLITAESVPALEQESATAGKDFGELLVQKGIIKDIDLVKIKAKLYQWPVAELQSTEIDKELIKLFPENIITTYRLLPFARVDQKLKVAVLNPEDLTALEALKFISSDRDVIPEKYVITYKDFEAISRNFRTLSGEIGSAIQTFSQEQSEKRLEIDDKTENIDQINAEAPVTRIVAVIVKHAVESRASDIHVEPFEESIRVRFRIDGDLQTSLTLPIGMASALVSRIKILSDLKIDETRLAQDGRFSTKVGDRKIDFRVSTFPTRNGEKTVMRILDPLTGNIELSDLGLEGRNLNLLLENIAKPFGAILITGPTGSGKSTTLAALLRKMNDETINIVTLENPIEYYVSGVNQSQIHEEIGYTFASGLRHILRQDPDVIMVGEVRDGETAGLMTQAALTGHVVLSTIHTNDTVGVIPRLIDMGVEKYLIAPSVNLVVAQRLTRRLCKTCKQLAEPNPAERQIIEKALRDLPVEAKAIVPEQWQVCQPGAGCKDCRGKQFKGRIAVMETLAMTPELEKIILTDISEEKLRQEARRQGMVTMYQDGIIKVLKGVTTIQEILQVAQDVEVES